MTSRERTTRGRRGREERGASLILAIVFIVVVGGIGGAIISAVNSAVKGRVVLDTARDRQYAADGAIESSIAAVRGQSSPAQMPCGPFVYKPPPSSPASVNKVSIHVDCIPAPTLSFKGFLQRNVIFVACESQSPSVTCGASGNPPVVIRAQVNFEAVGSGTATVTRTWVQSWSVNG